MPRDPGLSVVGLALEGWRYVLNRTSSETSMWERGSTQKRKQTEPSSVPSEEPLLLTSSS